jgi:hypothetical protein
MGITKNEKLFFPIIKLWYTPIDDVDEITENSDGSVSVYFNYGQDWNLIYSSRNSINFSENQKEVNEGILYEQNLEFKNPGDDFDNNLILNALANTDVIIRLEFTEGDYKLFGSLENPVRMLSGFKSGDMNTSRTIQASRSSDTAIPYIVTES